MSKAWRTAADHQQDWEDMLVRLRANAQPTEAAKQTKRGRYGRKDEPTAC